MTHSHPGDPARLANTVWSVLLGSQFVYIGIAVSDFHLAQETPFGGALLGPLLGFIGLCLGVIAQLIWQTVPGGRDPGPARPDADPALAGKSIARQIVVWSLDESVAVFGLVLALLGHDIPAWIGLFALSLVLTALHKPFHH